MPRSIASTESPITAEDIRRTSLLKVYQGEMCAIAGSVKLSDTGHASVRPFGGLPPDARLRLKWLLKRHQVVLKGSDIEVSWTSSKSTPGRVFVHPVKDGKPFVPGVSPEPPRTTYRRGSATPRQVAETRTGLAEGIAMRLMLPLGEVRQALSTLPDDTDPLSHVRATLAAS